MSLSHLNGGGNVEGSLEGWRAVLTVVLRYGMAEKQRVEYNFLAPREDGSGVEGRDDKAERMEVDNVKAMVHGVKTRGVSFLIEMNNIIANEAFFARERIFSSM